MKYPSLSKQAYPPIPEKVSEKVKKIVNYIFTHSKKDLNEPTSILKSEFAQIDGKNRLLID
jgi:hypothetical protein